MKLSANPLLRPLCQVLTVLTLLGLWGQITGCKNQMGPPPSLEELKFGEDLKASGQRLINIPLGVHPLTPANTPSKKAILAVHGHKSQGYEWVTSLHQYAETGAHVYWLRWDWNQCPLGGTQDLEKAIQTIQARHPLLQELHIFAHSYGGVIATMVAQTIALALPLHIHAIASPLAGMGQLNTLCPPTQIHGTSIQSHVTFTQWRTQHALDGAFKDEKIDPQLVHLPGAQTVDLPETFNGRRLGHNWAVSYASTQWLAAQKSKAQTKKSESHQAE